jgi:hypothetical protein
MWTFTDKVSSARREQLSYAPTAKELVAMVVGDARRFDISVAREQGDRIGDRPDLQGSVRGVWSIRVASGIGDLFFNGVSGYRAAFCMSPSEGEHVNGLLLGTIAPDLITVPGVEQLVGHGRAKLRDSLRHQTAKIWVDENRLDLSNWIELIVHIDHRPWVKAAQEYLRAIDRVVLEGQIAYRTSRVDDCG